MNVFPAEFNRLVIADGISSLGVTTASLLLREQDLIPKHIPIVLRRAGNVKITPADEAALVERLTPSDDQPSPLESRVSVASKDFVAQPSDVIVYVCNENFSLSVLQAACAGLPANTVPTVLLIASSLCIPSVISTMNSIQKWKVILVRCPYLAAPALTNSVPEFIDRLTGPLENVCLGVALGVTRLLRVNASQPTDIVPLDIALNTALVSFSLFMRKRINPALHRSNHVDVTVMMGDTNSVVWGMIGEYIIDYYGRFHAQIKNAIPPGLFNADPTLAFNVHFPDWWNYGLALFAPIDQYRVSKSNQTKEHLRKFPHATTVERMRITLKEIDAVCNELGAGRVTTAMNMNGETYGYVMRLLSGDPVLNPLLEKISLNFVNWEMYVKRVCVGVLHYAAKFIMNYHTKMVLPKPVPVYHNDLIFNGTDRAPDPNYNLRRWFPGIHWTLRAGQQHNGELVRLRPGGTTGRRVAIIAQPHVQLLISKLAKEQNLTKEVVEGRAEAILRGIGDNINHRQMRALGGFIRTVFRTLYERVNVNTEAFERIFKLARQPRRPIIMIPSHRSYIDFMILSYLMLVMGFAPPHICAGEDFLRLGGISDMMRGAGAFFMRRSFKGDKLYGALFKEYVRHLVRDSRSLEFFIEGKRSRTGKTLAPKLGLLKMCTDAFFEKQEEIDDVLVLPVSLSYEKLLEGNVYADELMGIPKPKETVGNLLKSASILKNKYGSLNIEVGEPVSLKSFAMDPNQIPAEFKPFVDPNAPPVHNVVKPSASNTSGMGEGGGYTPNHILSALGWRVTYDLQQRIVVTPTALLAATLLSMHDTASLIAGVPVAIVSSNVEWLRSAVLHRGGLMNDRFAGCTGAQLVPEATKHLNPRIWISPLSHVFLNEETTITTKVLLHIYSNQIIHVFGDEALLAVAAMGAGEEIRQQSTTAVPAGAKKPSSSDPEENPVSAEIVSQSDVVVSQGDLRKSILFLRKLMSSELPNFQAASPVPVEAWYQYTLRRIADDKTLRNLPLSDANDEELRFQRTQLLSFSSHVLYPYIESYYVAALALFVLVKDTNRIADAQLANLAHRGALTLHGQKAIDFVHCSCKENMQNAIAKFVELGLVAVERQPSFSYTLMPLVRKDEGAKLMGFIRQVNSFRWHKATSDNAIMESINVLRELFAGMTKKAKI